MPEGPSLVILREAVASLKLENTAITKAEGTAAIPMDRLRGKKVKEFRTWGKHFLICLDDCLLRIHFLLFGSYRINETAHKPAKLSLFFRGDALHFYACSVKLLPLSALEDYDWSADIMSAAWKPAKALKKMQQKPGDLVCDLLLDQNIFSGSGNIVKNEVLFRCRVHPESRVAFLPEAKQKELISEVRKYGRQFLAWKKAGTLRQHWQAHTRDTCPRCHIPFQLRLTGKTRRRSFFCTSCQQLYLDT